MKNSAPIRIRILSIGILAFALILVGKLYFVQIVSGEEFSSRADRQYLRSNYNYFNRGSIFFENKNGELISAATLKTGFILAITPNTIDDDVLIYNEISKIIELDRELFFRKSSNKASVYEEVARRIPSDKADEISALKLSGVRLYRERWRFYPGNSMASNAVGFMAYKEDELAGRYGLERYYENVLSRNNDSVFVNFFAEIFSNIQDSLIGDKAMEGDIVTSIEPSVQAFLEQELKKTNEKWSSEYSGGIIMNPKTGAIYAMGISPSFDLNNFQDVRNPKVFSNPMVENVYEMGSIIKPLTLASAIDAGAISANTTYFDSGSMTLNGRTFSNFDGKARGLVSMQEVLNQSLNTGVAFAVSKMGKENFAKYMMSFGIGEETGIDLPSETHGLVENLKSPRDIEYATASFGQGIALTPIATVRALATLGNGGLLINPHIVKKINYKIGGSKKITPNPGKQVLSKETSEEISRMLVNTVDNALLGGTVKIPNYSVAAKTGTAQVAKEDGRGYYENKYLHSFFGYFPAYDPKFLVFMYTMDPKGIRYASETLTHSFMDVTKFLINYYEIPPDR